MKNRVVEFTPKKILYYLLGFSIVSLGVIFMLRGRLGAGAWDTVTANLYAFMQYLNIPITLGTSALFVNFFLFLIVILYTKKWKNAASIIPIFTVSALIDFWDILVFGDFVASTIFIQLVFSLIGGILIPLGLALVISSHFPATVFDEFQFVVMDFLRIKSLTVGRYIVEFLGIGLGTIFGFLAKVGFGAVNIGSIIMAVILPPMLRFFIRKLGTLDEEY